MPMAFFDPLELSMWDGFCHPGTEPRVGTGGIGVELAASQAPGVQMACPKCWLGAVGLGGCHGSLR